MYSDFRCVCVTYSSELAEHALVTLSLACLEICDVRVGLKECLNPRRPLALWLFYGNLYLISAILQFPLVHPHTVHVYPLCH